jgi:glycosyltransferase involved in cell wall biosynthesis
VITAAVSAELATHAEVYAVDTAVSADSRVAYHAARVLRHAQAARRIVQYHQKGEKRSLYVACPGGAAIVYMLPLVLLARLLGYEIFVHHHSFAYISRWSILMSALVLAGGRAARHIVLCPEMGMRFDQRYRLRRRSTVSSNAGWIPARSDVAASAPAGRALRIGHLGTLSHAKGFGEVADLTLALMQDGLDVELWLAGASPTVRDKARLDSAVNAIGRDRCRLFEVLQGRAKERFFDEIDVFVLPSRYKHEAEPLVVFEALQAGVPVVAYKVGCIGSQLDGCGLLVAKGGSLKVNAAPYVRQLSDDGDFYAGQSRAARDRFDEARRTALVDAGLLTETLTGREQQ